MLAPRARIGTSASDGLVASAGKRVPILYFHSFRKLRANELIVWASADCVQIHLTAP